ncbi:MAG TPA: hypothetical protein VJG30_00315 [Candidatus Nanoarchaeia archaeon]|nr:hypothetical protein [Candidatus Nanoarchaeia archaeon]
MIDKELLLEEIYKIKENGYMVIAEGKKDKIALNNLGILNIKILNKALFKIIEDIDDKEVVILTDLDKKGRELYHKLNSGLQRKGIKVNNNFRNILFRTGLSHIEGLDSFLKKD